MPEYREEMPKGNQTWRQLGLRLSFTELIAIRILLTCQTLVYLGQRQLYVVATLIFNPGRVIHRTQLGFIITPVLQVTLPILFVLLSRKPRQFVQVQAVGRITAGLLVAVITAYLAPSVIY
ncbi:hypothetical protein A2961_04340 [Candidatus Woesebacteria bacterium RIFCSPLOWO2_01_FULL_39_21]|uniref:Uncharacterized protein n=1 Tax=Candidatus Woesebacteria bacterium RIFCSPLOWO2_01_FULL_39_21 TaxID=1802519 RepID=A0A1F8BMF3_9BACT|nr:MAG: hypothetical protein A2691_01810 [Candidatus Woesebacteria bacterium RIFCSPHIGHO2_01_FULL_39_23]OGM64458.1 MAG: hypothetical protein A2961_04340 [Candidatus Woesebacteria bacterium RIFCSPLOWO2_01_FULL_39_21]